MFFTVNSIFVLTAETLNVVCVGEAYLSQKDVGRLSKREGRDG